MWINNKLEKITKFAQFAVYILSNEEEEAFAAVTLLHYTATSKEVDILFGWVLAELKKTYIVET